MDMSVRPMLMKQLCICLGLLLIISESTNGARWRSRANKPSCDKMDFTLLLDSSNNVDKENFPWEIHFARRLVEKLNIGPDNVKFAVMYSGGKAHTYFDLNRYSNAADIMEVLPKIPYVGGIANVSGAIWRMRTNMYTPTSGDRRGVPNVALIISRGPSSNKQSTINEAKLARNNGIMLFYVGKYPGTDFGEVRGIVSKGDYVQLPGRMDHIQADDIADSMIHSICLFVPEDYILIDSGNGRNVNGNGRNVNGNGRNVNGNGRNMNGNGRNGNGRNVNGNGRNGNGRNVNGNGRNGNGRNVNRNGRNGNGRNMNGNGRNGNGRNGNGRNVNGRNLVKDTAEQPGSGGSTDNGLFTCTFEDQSGSSTLCGMVQSNADEFDWELNRGYTPSESTGPLEAFSKPYYVFIEASQPRTGDTAILQLPSLYLNGEVCVKFACSMYGRDTGMLRLEKTDSTDVMVLWSLSGNKGRGWLSQKVQISLESDEQLQFAAVRGSGVHSDIALDSIKVIGGRC